MILIICIIIYYWILLALYLVDSWRTYTGLIKEGRILWKKSVKRYNIRFNPANFQWKIYMEDQFISRRILWEDY